MNGIYIIAIGNKRVFGQKRKHNQSIRPNSAGRKVVCREMFD
jgi:hypothetical protein